MATINIYFLKNNIAKKPHIAPSTMVKILGITNPLVVRRSTEQI